MRYPLPPSDPSHLPTQVLDLTRQIEQYSSSRWLSNATIAGDLTIKDGGNLTIGAGSTLNIAAGNIRLRDGQIEGAALANQIGAVYRGAGASNFATGTGWDEKATVTFTRPSWASTAIVRASGAVRAQHEGTSELGYKIRLTSNTGWASPPAYGTLSYQDRSETTWHTVSTNYATVDAAAADGKTFTVSVQAAMERKGLGAHGGNQATVTAIAIWMR